MQLQSSPGSNPGAASDPSKPGAAADEPVLYDYMLYHGPEMHLRASLNGVPFYRSAATPGVAPTTSCIAQHLLRPGANTFTFEVYQSTSFTTASFHLYRMDDWSAAVVEYWWPAPLDDLHKVERPPLPFFYTTVFELTDVTVAPPYERAKSGPRFSPEGNEELHVAVQSFHHALAKGDAGQAVDMLKVKTDHLSEAYPGDDSMTSAWAYSHHAERLPGMKFDPYIRDEMHFESFADNRVAYVTRIDGRPAISGVAANGAKFHSDLWLTYLDGAWRIFR